MGGRSLSSYLSHLCHHANDKRVGPSGLERLNTHDELDMIVLVLPHVQIVGEIGVN